MDTRAAESFLNLAEQASAGITGPNGKSSLEQLEERSGDLLAAIAWFVDAGRTDEAFRLANALYRFWINKQRFDEGAVWFDRVLASPGGDDGLRGKASLNAGFMPFWVGDDERAAELFGRALEIGRRLDDPPLISHALGSLARVAMRTDVAEGRRLAREALACEALETGERIGDQFTKPFAISGLAAIASNRREFERAATLVGAAEAIMEAQHMAWPPDERPHYERLLATLPESMGSGEFDRARSRGHSMASSEAVDFALGARSPG